MNLWEVIHLENCATFQTWIQSKLKIMIISIKYYINEFKNRKEEL